jgi:hypothetical protein
MSDRAVQDEVIRYLADAGARASGSPAVNVGEAVKAGQFANFLARRYYRDRIGRSFRYSHRFRAEIGGTAVQLVDSNDFDRFLSECVLGSLASARRVAEMARTFLSEVRGPAPWWPALVDYECAYFLQAATSERSPASNAPLRGTSAVCARFEWDLPELVRRLRSGEPAEGELRRPVTLLFSRTHAGRIYVVEVEEGMERVFLACDGVRSLDQIATAAGVSVDVARQAIGALAEIGAIIGTADSSGAEAPSE